MNKKETIYWFVGMIIAVAGVTGVFILESPTFYGLSIVAIFVGGMAVGYNDINKKEEEKK